jgi:DNA-directed RNA polymerase subunit M/transcription elongation factor TFIIS
METHDVEQNVYCETCKILKRRDHFKKNATDKGQIRSTCPECGETEVVYLEKGKQ